MDLTSLDILRVVAAECSITRAAEILGRAPSNVSSRIQQLERDIGAPLFSRHGKRMTLTKKGEIFLNYAVRVLTLLSEARQAVKPSAPAGPFLVGTMESTAASRLPDILATFRTLWPAVSLQLTMGATRELIQRVRAHELDCALVAVPNQDRNDGIDTGYDPDHLEGVRVFVEDLIIVLPSNHPKINTAADLRVDTLAALEPGCTYREIAERWGRTSKSLRTAEVSSYHAILASVATGQAAGVMTRSVFSTMAPEVAVKTHTIGPIDTLLIRRRGDRTPTFQAFLDVLKDRANRKSDAVPRSS